MTPPDTTQPKQVRERSRLDRLAAWTWHVGLQFAIWFGGGALVLNTAEPPPPDTGGFLQARGLILIAVLSGVAAALSARRLVRRHPRRLLFATLLHAIVLLVTLVACEIAARARIPEWPGRELHGVPAGQWERAQAALPSGRAAVGINQWGQRDRERTTIPLTGTLRIAFVGDSFLEEGSDAPVSIAVEQHLGREDVEVINLGVSASGPDEYYDRICRVAIPLGARHCVMFLYAGNDFVSPPRTLESVAGIAAVAPRPSLLRSLGLQGINHALTNHRRPVLQAWFSGADLAAQERSLHEFLLHNDNDTARRALLYADELAAPERIRLAERIEQPEFEQFLDVLRHPDAGRFRSYYLSSGLWAASVGGGQWDPNSPATAWYWARQTAEYCRARSIRLTLVIVPEGFQVDPRMVEQWAPLADMRHLTATTRRTAEEFRRRAVEGGCDVLDLHPVLDGVRGAYLNVDGHWSETGVNAAAAAITEHLLALGVSPLTVAAAPGKAALRAERTPEPDRASRPAGRDPRDKRDPARPSG